MTFYYRVLVETIGVVRRQEEYLAGQLEPWAALEFERELLRSDWVMSLIWFLHWVKEEQQ